MKFAGQTQTNLITSFCSDGKKEHLVETLRAGTFIAEQQSFLQQAGMAEGSPLPLAPLRQEVLS